MSDHSGVPSIIVLVDDDNITLELLQHILEEFVSGEIIAFSSSIKALGFIQTMDPGRISLMICDWQMPEVDGIGLLKVFRRRDPGAPFLMLTGSATRELVMAAKQAGASGFVAKPFRNSDLTEKVTRLLNLSR